MAHIIRDNEIVPIPIAPGKKVKIGSNYQPPLNNYVEYDQLWVQDIMAFGKTPWSWIRWKLPEWIFGLTLWFAVVVALNLLGRALWRSM
jgi:hypothetical protein